MATATLQTEEMAETENKKATSTKAANNYRVKLNGIHARHSNKQRLTSQHRMNIRNLIFRYNIYKLKNSISGYMLWIAAWHIVIDNMYSQICLKDYPIFFRNGILIGFFILICIKICFFHLQPEWMKTKEYWDKTFETRYELLKKDSTRPPLKVIKIVLLYSVWYLHCSYTLIVHVH